jgi:hypothetical protein
MRSAVGILKRVDALSRIHAISAHFVIRISRACGAYKSQISPDFLMLRLSPATVLAKVPTTPVGQK